MNNHRCPCGCGRVLSYLRIKPSDYQVFLGGKPIGRVQKQTRTIEGRRPHSYIKDTGWSFTGGGDFWLPTRGEAVQNLLSAAHASAGSQP